MLPPRGGEDQPERVSSVLLLGDGRLDAGGQPFGERVAARGAHRVDRPAVFTVLRCLGEKVSADLDHFAVDGDNACVRVNLTDGQRGQLAPAQAAVGGGVSHELVTVAASSGGQCPARRATSRSEGISAWSIHSTDSPAVLTAGTGKGAARDLPMDFRQPVVH